ncbi:hypothetical protein V5O48_005982 [Marasmius crinis-equi]|uniref:Uncharacterized protein n=1 Tax=Marasmius crinis-equi TaxID=585013 RepID=A0ABR3FKY2_9AGAR
MQTDSETESESGEENGAFTTPSAPISLFCTTSQTYEGSDRNILSALLAIQGAQLSEITSVSSKCLANSTDALKFRKNGDARANVLGAATVIIEFLSHILELREKATGLLPTFSGLGEALRLCGQLPAYASSVEPRFLSILFDHRKVFRRLATRELLPAADGSSMVVCWVDTLLVKLAEVTVLVAGGLAQDTEPSESVFIRRQREHDNLAAATQLPSSWMSVPSVLDSTYGSPAARRLALRLLFAVYTVGPWFSGNNPWNNPDNLSSSDLLRVLDRYISQSPVKHGVDFDALQERLLFSMTLSLYAAADLEVRQCQTSSPLRPRTLGNLLEYLHSVLKPSNLESDRTLGGDAVWLSSPFEVLDAPQALLLRWRETVLWCWKTWNDSRIANSDIVICLTAQWLYHHDHVAAERATSVGLIDVAKLLDDPNACGGALSCVLQDLVGVILASPDLSNHQPELFYGLSAMTTKTLTSLLRGNFTNSEFQLSSGTREIFRCLASLFVLLPEDEGSYPTTSMKHEMLELMSLVDISIIKGVLPALCKDQKLAFTEKMDDREWSVFALRYGGSQGEESDVQNQEISHGERPASISPSRAHESALYFIRMV